MLASWLQELWFQRRLAPALWLLLPLSLFFSRIAERRRKAAVGERLRVPVVVVGNITVGGAGKTPLTLWLAGRLRERGWRPGIVSRGYGGDNAVPHPVDAQSTPAEAGDEAVLLARRSGVPLWIGRRRADAGRALLAAHPEVDVILCDDGLQHYGLARDVEIAVFDGRGAGNGRLLPAGPLREGLSRLATVDAIVCNGAPDDRLPAEVPRFEMSLRPGPFYRLGAPEAQCAAENLKGRRLYALAGIGDPGRFFRTLEGLGLAFEAHPFPDHHAYRAADLAFAADGVLLMTEKDAVKCTALPAGESWVLPVEAVLPPALIDHILEKLRGRQAA